MSGSASWNLRLCGRFRGAFMKKQYLGDSVYVEIEHGGIKLTTNNGLPDDPRNVIFLEPEVYALLVSYVERARAFYKAERDKAESNA